MAQKDASVAELTKNFENSTAVLLTEYRGLTVAELKQLRSEHPSGRGIRRGEEHADQDRREQRGDHGAG